MTTYAQPAKFSHGDFPTAANLDTLIDAMDAIGELASDGTIPAAGETLPKFNFPVYWNREKDPLITSNADSDFCIIHRERYLHYKSTGAIVDLGGLESEVSLPDEGDFNVYDLDSVPWLTYGMIYRVTGVDFCCEDVDP